MSAHPRQVYTVENGRSRASVSGPIHEFYDYRQPSHGQNMHNTAKVVPEPRPEPLQNHQHVRESESSDQLSDKVWFSFAQKCVAEAVGCMIFVFIGSLAAVFAGDDILRVAVAHGVTMAINIITLGHISGGHFNPAVTLGITLVGKLKPLEAAGYVPSQLFGAFIGGLLVRAVIPAERYCLSNGGATLPSQFSDGGVDWGMALGMEVVLSYILVQVVLNSAVDSDCKNVLAPLAIGFTIMVDICAGGAISGASMNPARSFGPLAAFSAVRQTDSIRMVIGQCLTVDEIWTYSYLHWAGPIAGSVLAAILYKFLFARREYRFKWNFH